MPRRVRSTATFIALLASLAVVTLLRLDTLRLAVSRGGDPSPSHLDLSAISPNLTHDANRAVREDHRPHHHNKTTRPAAAAADPSLPSADSLLLPAWEVLVILAPSSSDPPPGDYSCLFSNNATSPATRAWALPSTNQTTFLCDLPPSTRRRRGFLRPVITRSGPALALPPPPPAGGPLMIRWNFLTYESFSTRDDVVLFAKGVNHRQGINRPPSELACVFFSGDGAAEIAVRTAVTSSAQEVFRCPHPPKQAATLPNRLSVSLEISQGKGRQFRVPSLALYAPPRRSRADGEDGALICACTMVYNVAKFLKEWVMYHSAIGVDRFVLYDNGSDDDLEKTIGEIAAGGGYELRSVRWPWPKTQEAGFSHCAVNARDSCEWMMFIDVDEFVFSPEWLNSSRPSKEMLRSLLPGDPPPSSALLPAGEVTINCNEFGPSGRRAHPTAGVTQGYTCRRRTEQRHKSIVRLEAVDGSLLNVVHHFKVKEGAYRTKAVGAGEAVVNHYKYQAWPEFKAKFRRRVSAYVVDWRQALNLESQDRTPGLGFEPVEPRGWTERFCEVSDDRLKSTTERWFGVPSPAGPGPIMAWER